MKFLVKCASGTIFGGRSKKGKELGWLREGEGGEEGLPARLEYLKNRVWVGGPFRRSLENPLVCPPLPSLRRREKLTPPPPFFPLSDAGSQNGMLALLYCMNMALHPRSPF